MALQSINLPILGWAFADLRDPTTHYDVNPNTWYQFQQRQYLVAKFDELPVAYRQYSIIQIALHIRVKPESYDYSHRVYLGGFFDEIENIATWTPSEWPPKGRGTGLGYKLAEYDPVLAKYPEQDIRISSSIGNYEYIDVLRARSIYVYTELLYDYLRTKLGDNSAAYVEVVYNDDDTLQGVISNIHGPAGNSYADPRDPITFDWEILPDWKNYYDTTVGQSSAVFHWRELPDGAWNDVAISGSTTSVTIPANTFPVNKNINWYVSATDTYGNTSDSLGYTFTTADAIITTVLSAPINSAEDGSKSITFEWSFNSDSGYDPTRVLLEWKKSTDDDNSWQTLLDSNEPETSYTVGTYFFPAGTMDWRVSAWNRDNIQGEYAAASFAVVVAPGPPSGLAVNAVPFATLSWQAQDQQAYRITIGDTLYGPFFSAEKTFTLDEPLYDGTYTAKIAVQGEYSFWSDDAEITFTIQNQPGTALQLLGDFGIDANLGWPTAGSPDHFLVYRDNVLIARTPEKYFNDRHVLGQHEYFLIQKLNDGNYTKSNILVGTCVADGIQMALFTGGDWVSLRLSDQSSRYIAFSFTRLSSARHISGAVYPVLELSEFEEETVSFRAAASDPQHAADIEALRGKIVIVKTRDGDVIVGAVTSLKKTATVFYRSYDFTISMISWEDYINVFA